ncbi:MAG: hypothetical protein MZV65_31370 [Chromatiales bacterium]|nr:hypothetical protein [Chromatiales bacterium]
MDLDAHVVVRERSTASDWALDGIEPATLPTVLALGADPYDYDVNYVARRCATTSARASSQLPE